MKSMCKNIMAIMNDNEPNMGSHQLCDLEMR